MKYLFIGSILVFLTLFIVFKYLTYYQDCDLTKTAWTNELKHRCETEPLHLYEQ